MCLDTLVAAHLGHSVGEIVKVVLWSKAHMPLLVHRHDFVEVASFVTLAAQFELALLATSND